MFCVCAPTVRRSIDWPSRPDADRKRTKASVAEYICSSDGTRNVEGGAAGIGALLGAPGTGKSHALDLAVQAARELVASGVFEKILCLAFTFNDKMDLRDMEQPTVAQQQLAIHILFCYFCGLQVNRAQFVAFANNLASVLPANIDLHIDSVVMALERRFFCGSTRHKKPIAPAVCSQVLGRRPWRDGAV